MSGFELDFTLTRHVRGGAAFTLDVALQTRDGIAVVTFMRATMRSGSSTGITTISPEFNPSARRVNLSFSR